MLPQADFSAANGLGHHGHSDPNGQIFSRYEQEQQQRYATQQAQMRFKGQQ
jgi:hypothetical protein